MTRDPSSFAVKGAGATTLIPIYRRNLAKYEAQGDAEKVRIEKALIKRIENETGRR